MDCFVLIVACFTHIHSTEPNTHLCGSSCYNPKQNRCCESNHKPHSLDNSGVTIYLFVCLCFVVFLVVTTVLHHSVVYVVCSYVVE